LRVDVTVTDEDGVDVTNKNFVIATGLQGISDVDGNGSLAAGNRHDCYLANHSRQ
jgi:hypothetical protein